MKLYKNGFCRQENVVDAQLRNKHSQKYCDIGVMDGYKSREGHK